MEEPAAAERLTIVVEHLRASIAFYGMPLGLKMFRKHLGWYIEQSPWPDDPVARRAAKSALCRLDDPDEVERNLHDLWLEGADDFEIKAVEISPQVVETTAV